MARVSALIARIRELLQKNRIARYGLLILVVVVAGYLVAGRLFGGRGATQPATRQPIPAPSATRAPRPGAPAPAPGATPAPVPAAPGAPGTTATPKTSVVPPGPTGRPDPFIPLIVATPPGQAPPPGSMPPPPFPVPGQLPPPPLPGQVPGVPGGPVAVTGIVGNSKAVAVVVIGGRTEIVTPGDQIGDLRVLRIDSTRRTVTFLQAGRRFDVALGGE